MPPVACATSAAARPALPVSRRCPPPPPPPRTCPPATAPAPPSLWHAAAPRPPPHRYSFRPAHHALQVAGARREERSSRRAHGDRAATTVASHDDRAKEYFNALHPRTMQAIY
ncbi:probable pathogenesis-related protein ARB_02861 [Triticum aestivum]|uniref:probable pathogenesis-related protein ARB_02861 n=1 Tax=Triticum aestivum TaxID=4565 RepID=UPI001D01EFFD|nr:probable pathogenesis-related protein ARB_02861 [Triticum aestivum]